MLEMEYAESSSGRMRAHEFLVEQSDIAKAKIINEMKFLKKYGLQFSMIQSDRVKKIFNKPPIFEMRVRADKTFYRFPFVLESGTVFLLDGFKKQTNKIEQNDINRAIKRAKEFYKEREAK